MRPGWLAALPVGELVARLAETYRLIGELAARNDELAARVGQLERQAARAEKLRGRVS
jgi:hypothetical protein